MTRLDNETKCFTNLLAHVFIKHLGIFLSTTICIWFELVPTAGIQSYSKGGDHLFWDFIWGSAKATDCLFNSADLHTQTSTHTTEHMEVKKGRVNKRRTKHGGIKRGRDSRLQERSCVLYVLCRHCSWWWLTHKLRNTHRGKTKS